MFDAVLDPVQIQLSEVAGCAMIRCTEASIPAASRDLEWGSCSEIIHMPVNACWCWEELQFCDLSEVSPALADGQPFVVRAGCIILLGSATDFTG